MRNFNMNLIQLRSQYLVGALLIFLVVMTRSHHFISLDQLPGASWAVFFLAGFYIRSNRMLPGLLILVWSLDFGSYYFGNSSSFCITPAYLFLLPAYTSLWIAGRIYAHYHRNTLQSLLYLGVFTFIGASVCELFSSGGFYFYSGRFVDPTLTEFLDRVILYFPSSLQSMGFYVIMATIVHILFYMIKVKVNEKNGIVKS